MEILSHDGEQFDCKTAQTGEDRYDEDYCFENPCVSHFHLSRGLQLYHLATTQRMSMGRGNFTAPHVTYWLVLLLVGTVGIGLGKVDVHTVSHQTQKHAHADAEQ